MKFFRLLAFITIFTSLRAVADDSPAWTTPIAPFHIVDNVYYVGSQDLAAYLIVTAAGDILINSNLESSVPLIKHSVEQLGFHFTDIKILLISHAHFDHDAGSAAILKQTGAKYMVMDADVPSVEDGGFTDFAYGGKQQYPPAKVDRVLHDGDKVTLGGSTLVAHKTAGHTRGCTTWTMVVQDHGVNRNVVFVGSWNVNPGYRLVSAGGKPASYPGIAADYVHTFEVLRALPCDFFLGAHGQYFDMLAKLKRAPAEGSAAWIDPTGYKAAVAERQKAFESELAKQKAAAN